MKQITHQTSSQKPSLLFLNDDCIREVFKHLRLTDYINLAATCSRLAQIENRKYKNISVATCFGSDSSLTAKKFANILTWIGKHIKTVYLATNSKDGIMKIITRHTNLSGVELAMDSQVWGALSSYRGGLPFRNLKELRVGRYIKLSNADWKNCFSNNPEIETLQYNERYVGDDDEFMALFEMLPKLKSLTIDEMVMVNETNIDYLTSLTGLTKFSFNRDYFADDDYNKLLIGLAEKLKLVELNFAIRCNAHTFAILESFQHLEVLSMRDQCKNRVLENTIFPSMLKQIKLDGFKISCQVVLSIVKQLTLLQGFNIGSGMIFLNNGEYESFPNRPCLLGDINDSKIISGIAVTLREEKRKLKLIFTEDNLRVNQICKYTDNLEIIKNPRVVKRAFDDTMEISTSHLTNNNEFDDI